MKTIITGLLAFLLTVGVGLTLYLPSYQPSVTDATSSYIIDLPSLKSPLLMSDTLLTTLKEEDSVYGLRLGLFGQLTQAINLGKSLGNKPEEKNAFEDTAIIVKATDKQRFWYFLILGPYSSEDIANKKRMLLLQNQDLSTTIIKWPLEQATNEDESK